MFPDVLRRSSAVEQLETLLRTYVDDRPLADYVGLLIAVGFVFFIGWAGRFMPPADEDPARELYERRLREGDDDRF